MLVALTRVKTLQLPRTTASSTTFVHEGLQRFHALGNEPAGLLELPLVIEPAVQPAALRLLYPIPPRSQSECIR